jgi:hypothetical protein
MSGSGRVYVDLDQFRTSSEPFRWPRDRGRFPAHFVISYGWRQTTIYTPVVRKKCVIATVRFGLSARGFLGVAAFRDQDDEPTLRIGLGFAEFDAYAMGFERRDDDA